MKGRKFTAREKQRALQDWEALGFKTKAAYKIAYKYKCHVNSLWGWKRLYDGSLESLENRSSRPLSPHPKAHSGNERQLIVDTMAANPNFGYLELWSVLRVKHSYNRDYYTMYRFIKTNFEVQAETYERYKAKPYNTPEMVGVKAQMDVKYVPRECLVGLAKKLYEEQGQKYYQFTMIDEASRERFIYTYTDKSAASADDFIKRSIVYFGYKFKTIQTDNGKEFINRKVRRRLKKLGIEHKRIKPYTPRHNGKVERSHRTDQEKFYKFLEFETLAELREKQADWLTRYNNIASSALRDVNNRRTWQTPLQKREELLVQLKAGAKLEKPSFIKSNRLAA